MGRRIRHLAFLDILAKGRSELMQENIDSLRGPNKNTGA